jgi:hypothetical protein
MQTVNKIGVGSATKVFGLTLGFLGFFVGIIYALMFQALGELGDEFPISGSGGLGIVILILVPVFYGLAGFLIGALSAAVYNFVAKKFGGLEIELSEPNHKPAD